MTKNNSTFVAMTMRSALPVGQRLSLSRQDTDGIWRNYLTSQVKEVYFLGGTVFKVITSSESVYLVSAPYVDKSSLVVYNGGTESWAHSLSSDNLKLNHVYKIERCEQHSWHTDLYLAGLDGPYNSVWFDSLEDEQSQTAAEIASTIDDIEGYNIAPDGNIVITK